MTARAAALYVCAHADTVDDAAMLLDALGLVDGGALVWPQPGVLDVVDIKDIARTHNGWRGFR